MATRAHLLLSAGLAGVVPMLWGAPLVIARPTITAPASATQGATTTLTIGARRARGCRLTALGPQGRTQIGRIRRASSLTARIAIAADAATGTWTVRVRCRAISSESRRMEVSGNPFDAGRRLFVSMRTARIGGKRPKGYRPPRRTQNGPGGPQLDLPPLPVGIGSGDDDGARAERAIDWANSKLRTRVYSGFGLRFVAYAYAATDYPNSATILANELGPVEGDQPRNAPRGALMWFTLGDPNIGRNDGHVGISLGRGQMIHAFATVKVDEVDRSPWWRSRYQGWTPAPDDWAGRPPALPPPRAGEVAPLPPPAPPPIRKVLTVDNRATNGMEMTQDDVPLRLTTEKRTFCTTNRCNIDGTERTTGQTYDAAVCQSTGERFTNGNDASPADDGNPERFESTRYYGVKLEDGTFGWVNEVWVRAADRGGLDLPTC